MFSWLYDSGVSQTLRVTQVKQYTEALSDMVHVHENSALEANSLYAHYVNALNGCLRPFSVIDWARRTGEGLDAIMNDPVQYAEVENSLLNLVQVLILLEKDLVNIDVRRMGVADSAMANATIQFVRTLICRTNPLTAYATTDKPISARAKTALDAACANCVQA